MSKDELIEKLADIEHQRWGDWQRWVHECTDLVEYTDSDGITRTGQVIPNGPWLRWERLIATDYADLPEHSKQSDRDQAMRYWPMIVDFVTEWLEDRHAKYAAAAWREDMS